MTVIVGSLDRGGGLLVNLDQVVAQVFYLGVPPVEELFQDFFETKRQTLDGVSPIRRGAQRGALDLLGFIWTQGQRADSGSAGQDVMQRPGAELDQVELPLRVR